ncbi:MAG: class I SAM-dependent methyltransferase [Acidobacteriota bacterium]|nr:class I SAM-dependent methyltransferase [Acidobacteriota bacterium]
MRAFPQLETSPDAMAAGESRGRQLQLKCPSCSWNLGVLNTLDLSAAAICPACSFTLHNQGGIWRVLTPDRQERFRQFTHEYQEVRAVEGRGSSNPDFYLRLPYEDVTGRHRWQWQIRGASFRFFETNILPQSEGNHQRGLDILDLGAGNCWMSYRLALRGHCPVAVDLIDNPEDGLGAARHYLNHLRRPFARFQAEMDRLPFQDHQFDLAIFNASFHYSEDYQRTVREVLRCLRRLGQLVIIDSPFYEHPRSGEEMVKERQVAFVRKFGFPSDSLASCEYLTAGILKDLEKTFRLSWRIAKPWYGLEWALRPFKARLLRRRVPSKFFIFWTTVHTDDRSL